MLQSPPQHLDKLLAQIIAQLGVIGQRRGDLDDFFDLLGMSAGFQRSEGDESVTYGVLGVIERPVMKSRFAYILEQRQIRNDPAGLTEEIVESLREERGR